MIRPCFALLFSTLSLSLSLSLSATAAPVTCQEVTGHWSQLWAAQTGHTVDSRALLGACTKLGRIEQNQMAARCWLGARSIHDDCGGWGPSFSNRGVDYTAWSVAPGAAAPPSDHAPPAGVGLTVLVDDPATGESVSMGAAAGVYGLGVNVRIDEGHAPPPTQAQQTYGRPSTPPAAPPPPPVRNAAMSPADFDGLLRAVEGESFSDDQLDLIRASARHAWFSCDQLAQLMGALTFGGDKVEAATIVRPRIVDPHNSYSLNESLTFSSDQDKVQALFR